MRLMTHYITRALTTCLLRACKGARRMWGGVVAKKRRESGKVGNGSEFQQASVWIILRVLT